MRALLHNLLLGFDTDNPQLIAGWQLLFDREIKAAATRPASALPDIRLVAAVSSSLPPPPATPPATIQLQADGPQHALRYYETASGGFLDLPRPARISINFVTSEAQITLTEQVLDAGNLEDLTLIALSPFLRRRRFFLTHAFAAAGKTAVLLCGPPGSGKTTTGLALLEQGWHYLANDATLLREENGQVQAFPSPGAINLHPHTLSLLPHLRGRINMTAQPMPEGKIILPRNTLLAGRMEAKPTRVGIILFPRRTDQPHTSLHEVSSAIGLARLIEENVDQWDRATYETHLDLLTHLSRQAAFYDLLLPRDQVPDAGFINALNSL